MNRRSLIKKSLATGCIIGLGTGGYFWFQAKQNISQLTIEATIGSLNLLIKREVSSIGEWAPAQVFNHCTQSIRFSLTGYPEHRSDTFKTIVGGPAFAAFSSWGKMKHGLNEPIPGAPVLVEEHSWQQALENLISTLIEFEHYSGELAPHFAYGELSKQDYTLAHIMHINNHFDELVIS